MDTLTVQNLRNLVNNQTNMCVSIFMTTHPVGAEGEQDTLRWKKLLQDAEHGLMDRSMRSVEARDFLAAAYNLPNDSAFWANRSQGLAAFISRDTWSLFRVPRPFDDVAIVSRRFQIKRLLPLLSDSSPFYILALSQNNVRLFRASHYQIEPVAVPGLPADMESVLNYTAVDRGSQVHSAMKGKLGKQAAVFHGQGGQWDTRKDDLAEFFRFVDDAIQPVLREQPAPLLLAGVEYLLPIYRSVNGHSQLLEQELAGNFDYATPTQLLEKAWPLAEPSLRPEQHDAWTRYTSSLGTGRTGSDIESVLNAALDGRIEVLVVNPNAVQWGTFNPVKRTVITHPDRQSGDEDLMELAIAETLKHRGTVVPGEPSQLPANTNMAALFRF